MVFSSTQAAIWFLAHRNAKWGGGLQLSVPQGGHSLCEYAV